MFLLYSFKMSSTAPVQCTDKEPAECQEEPLKERVSYKRTCLDFS